MICAASQKTRDELTQRLAKLKARQHPKNSVKKLPGYGKTWFYYKRTDTLSEGETGGSLRVATSDITTFVKKLRTRPPPDEAEEDFGEAIQGPGFEFPTDKEAAKSIKHWTKRFKHWHPPESLSNTTAPKCVLRLKPPLPSNEVEINGKRYKRVDGRQEMASLLDRGGSLIEKQQPTLLDAKFYGEILKEERGDVPCRFVMPSGDNLSHPTDIKEIAREYAISEIYATFPVASKVVVGLKKHLSAQGQTELASTLRVELATNEDDPDEVNQAHMRRDPTTTVMKLDDGDEASVYM